MSNSLAFFIEFLQIEYVGGMSLRARYDATCSSMRLKVAVYAPEGENARRRLGASSFSERGAGI